MNEGKSARARNMYEEIVSLPLLEDVASIKGRETFPLGGCCNRASLAYGSVLIVFDALAECTINVL